MTTEPKTRTAQMVKSAAIAPPVASALVATVGLGVVGWAVTVPRMRAMDMGVGVSRIDRKSLIESRKRVLVAAKGH